MSENESLDAQGIEVSVIDLDNRKRFGGFGHPVWTLPMGGGTIREAGLTIEVQPKVEMPTDRWRDHEAIQKLAEQSETNGGFAWYGDAIQVGNETLVGRDAMRLLTELWHRASARAHAGEEAIKQQSYEKARRELLDKVKEALG